jgi:uncharacterized protein (TIGR00288 family)
MQQSPVGSAAPVHHAPNAALLIDFDNVTMGIRSDLQTELKNLLSSDIVKGKVSVQRAYADWRRYPQYIVPLSESSIDLIFAPAYGSAKKNATDIRLAIDALELVFIRPEIGTFILLSGDSDFSSLVIKLKEYGKYVIGVGIRESSSDLLVQNCDEYYSYNALAGLVNTKDEEIVKWDPWQLVTEAIQRMKKNGDVMRADRLKQVMQNIDSSFDEGNIGMAKFSRFVTQAAEKGLITLTKLPNGQLEVDVPAPGAAKLAEMISVAPVARIASVAAPKTETSPSSEAPKRGRRGVRGRTPRAAKAQAEIAPIATAPIATAATDLGEAAPAVAAAAPVVTTPVENGVGSSGIRLTRDEAFDLVKRAVASLTKGEEAIPSSTVRAVARQLLGRDSESLNERNFARILQDAHDADMIDLRRRGADYEVANSATAKPVAQQLSASQPAAPKPAAQPPQPHGLSSRLMRGSRGPGGRNAEIPANLLSVGVVSSKREVAPAPIFQPVEELQPEPPVMENEIDEEEFAGPVSAVESIKAAFGLGRRRSPRVKKEAGDKTKARAPRAKSD